MALTKETVKHREMLGKKIRQLRTLHGYKQVELAELLGYESTGTISQIENGERGMKAEKIMLVAELFNIPVQVSTTNTPISTQDLTIISNLVEMIKLPPKKRPKKFFEVKKLLT